MVTAGGTSLGKLKFTFEIKISETNKNIFKGLDKIYSFY